MVAIAGGPMVFGSDTAVTESGEQPTQRIDVSPFSIQKTEVTNAQYRTCRLAGACSDPVVQTAFQDQAFDKFPVVWVTATQARAFCRWLGADLPDTYQWERAARGKDGRPWPWGTDPPDAAHANLYYPSDGLLPAGQLTAGATVDTGILDLVGNASEWTRTATAANAEGAWTLGDWDGKDRTVTLGIRGWGFVNAGGSITLPEPALPSFTGEAVGFRCAQPAR